MDLVYVRRARRAAAATLVAALAAAALAGAPARRAAASVPVDEVHYSWTGSSSVTFDWRGDATDLQYGPTSGYGSTVTGTDPSPMPFSSSGPFREAAITGLTPATTYHYSIGGGTDATFTTPPSAAFRFDVEADIGSTATFPNVGTVQQMIAADQPAMVLAPGDLSYANPNGLAAVDQHFNDVMAWSRTAAYMPVWGNHEWDNSVYDDLRDYKGRFAIPNAQAVPSAPSAGCCGEDWGWFDAGGVRFISYPDPYTSSTYNEWKAAADPVLAAAQADPTIRFIVTFGHRPAYSTGYHTGEPALAAILDSFGDTYSKYVLNFNGHSHDYERFAPIHGVTHVTIGSAGGSALEPPWTSSDPRTVYRAMHLAMMRVDVDPSAGTLRLQAVCGPSTSKDDISCAQGAVIDTVTIGGSGGPTAPPPPTISVDQNNPSCADNSPTAGSDATPYCHIAPAALVATKGQTVTVHSGTYTESVVVANNGTADAPIIFQAAPGANVTVTGKSSGFTMSGRSYVTVRGFTVTHTTHEGILATNSTNLTIANNTVSYSGQPVSGSTYKGIRLSGTTNSVITGNTSTHNSDSGIYLVSGSSGDVVSRNTTTYNARVYTRAAAGITIASPGNTVTNNVSHDNEDSGIEFTAGAGSSSVVGNLCYGNGDHGIDDLNAPNQHVIGNTIYNNTTAGINFEGTGTASQNAVVENNISVDNAIGGPRTLGDIRVDSPSIIGTVVDFNLVNMSSPGPLLTWGTTYYSTLDTFQAATGQMAHGVTGDPLWRSAGTGDFHLLSGSRAIDRGDSGVSGEATTDMDSLPRVDDPTTANVGVGPRAYDDLGAYEYRADQPPAVTLVVTPTSGTVPLDVTADASESDDGDATPIASYTLDFGDGTVVGPQSGGVASHRYTTSGVFTVRATVTDTAGLTGTSIAQVRVSDQPPAAALTVSPGSGSAPLAVTADASGSTDVDATPVASYQFDFGDGTTVGPQSGPTATHTYEATGDHTVTVRVADTAGNVGVTSRIVHVTDAAPVPALTVTPNNGPAPLEVTADATASTDTDGTPIASYLFDFGDGTTQAAQTTATATHTYPDPGTYAVTVTVTDTAGLTSAVSATVTVGQAQRPVASLTLSTTSGRAPVAVTADGSGSSAGSTGALTSYAFDFGDGTTTGPQATATASHTYPTPGTYRVTLTVTDESGNTDTATATITVADTPPDASLGVTPASALVGATVQADASASSDPDSTPIASYAFDFGDGTTVGPQAGATTAHAYAKGGDYPVTVTVTDTAGNSSTAVATVHVVDQPPSAALTVSPGSGLAPLAVTADASASQDNDSTPVASYRFDFGDGTVVGPQSAATAAHTFASPGQYVVAVTVTDTAGNASIASVTVTATDNPPTASLALSAVKGVPALTVTADASISSDGDATPIASYTFDFGDGTTVGPQSGPTAPHVYYTPGTYTVTVRVTDTAGLAATASRSVVVSPIVGNPGFETNTTGWNGYPSGVTLQRVAGGHNSNWAVEVDNTTGTTVSSCVLNDSPNWVAKTSAATYAASVWVRALSGTATVKIKLTEYSAAGANLGSKMTTVSVGTTWQKIGVTGYVPVSPGTSNLDLNVYTSNAPTGGCFQADDIDIAVSP